MIPYRKVPVGKTVHKIAYHEDTETYIISSSVPAPFVLERAKYAASLAAGVIEEANEELRPKVEPKGRGPLIVVARVAHGMS